LTSLAHGKGGQARQEINWFETWWQSVANF
jgi:hypothetical protein